MRHAAFLFLAAAALAAPAARAETRVVAQTNGWTAFDGTTERGMPTCGLETRDPNTGRHFLLQQVVGQDRPILRLSRPSWSLRAASARPVRIVIDRRIFAANATAAGREMSWPMTLDGPNGFEAAFRLGRFMRVEFPAGPDEPWNLSLTGTNGVMGAFMGCLRLLAIQPLPAPAESPPIQPPPPAEPPPLAPSPLTPAPEEPLRPPLEAPPQPVEPPAAVPAPAPAPPAEAPRLGIPPDKPVPRAPDGKAPDAKPGFQGSPVPL